VKRIDTRKRSVEEETLDDLSLEGDELKQALQEIAAVNRWLGGNSITLNGVEKLLDQNFKKQEITILDIGCGNGDMCRALAKWGDAKDYSLEIIGLDANAYALKCAKELSGNLSNVRFTLIDVFSDEFRKLNYDIAVSTLTMHHFSDSELDKLLPKVISQAKVGVVINDLQRSKLAYRLYQFICWMFQTSKLFRDDGLVSILRGFKKRELIELSERLGFKDYRIQWKWAFRYQWIIKKR